MLNRDNRMQITDFNAAQELELLSRDEGHFFDFKRADILPGKLEKTFVAMANADGGEIVVGIDNDDTLIPADQPAQRAFQ